MIKRLFLIISSITLLSGCDFSNYFREDKTPKERTSYGVFLGEDDSKLDYFYNYENIIIDVDEFKDESLKKLNDNEVNYYAYLSVGSLEKYRTYYDTYKDLTFMDYENWPDERWVDVSSNRWQEHIINEANRFKEKGATGLFLDNFDVYYIVTNEYECTEAFQQNIFDGLYNILVDLSMMDLKLAINSGTDFLEVLNEDEDSILNHIDIYVQESVFSTILDYEHDVFGKQNEEDHEYYLDIVSFMKKKSKILLIEYTTDEELIKEIKEYCSKNSIHYYISNNVNLKIN